MVRGILVGYLIVLIGGTANSVWMARYGCDGHPCGLWQDTVRKSPNKPRPHVNLAYAETKRRRPDLALTEYQKAELLLLQEPQNSHRDQAHALILMNMSSLWIDAKHFNEAREILKAGYLQYPHFPGFGINLALCYLQLGEPDKALVFLDDAEAHLDEYKWFVNTAPLWLDRAVALQQLGRCDEMHQDFQEHIRRDPDINELPEFQCTERN